jgi:carbohydrate-binding DOMON domain-containing protein
MKMRSMDSLTTTPFQPNAESRKEYDVAIYMAFTEDLANTVMEKSNSRGLEVAVNPIRRTMSVQIYARYTMHSKSQ